MTPQSPLLDERIKADLDDLADLRGLSPQRAGGLIATLVGAGVGRHDRAFRMAANACHIIAASLVIGGASREALAGKLVDVCLDVTLARPAAFRAFLCEGTLGALGLRLDGEVVCIEAPDLRFDLTWRQAVDALALVHFLMVADGLALFGEMREAFAAVTIEEDAVAASVKDLTRLFSRLGYRYRNQHFPERDLFRRNGALVTFVMERIGGGVHLADDLILDAWLHLVDLGERPMFGTVARRCHLIERAVAWRRQRARIGGDMPFDDTVAGGGVMPDAEGGWASASRFADGETEGETPSDWVRALPERPKVLTGTERARLLEILDLAPLHRDRALTVLRAVHFGALQDRLVRGGLVAEDAEVRRTYGDDLSEAEALRGHLINVAVLALKTGEGAQRDDLPKVQRIRRDGFNAPPAELAAALSECGGAIAGLIEELGAFRDAASGRVGRFEEDRAVFQAAFRKLTLPEGAVAQ